MPYHVTEVYPWGRSFAEYVDMFLLSKSDLAGFILGCGDGPSSFNYEAHLKGHHVISCDPIYTFAASAIKERIFDVADQIMEKSVLACKNDYDWDNYIFRNPEELKNSRLRTMELFVNDFSQNHLHQRYLTHSLPKLPFDDNKFTLTLVGNLLFLYDDILDFDFHLQSIIELCRVSQEVRVFPLTSSQGYQSTYFSKLCETFSKMKLYHKTIKTNYNFIKAAQETLIIRKL